MKKFIIKIFLFFIAVALCDYLFGIACQYMNDHSKGGGVRSRYYVCKESNEEVLVFGSSRAKHHYVPDIIEDSLGMTCYNTGEDGNGVIFSYGMLRMITQRYTPKLIIYDVSVFDIYQDDNMKYLDLLKPYYNEQGIDSIFLSIEPKTQLMMKSSFYRFNTTCLRIAGNYLRPLASYPKGYSAMYGTMNYEPQQFVNQKDIKKVDSLKLKFFEQFICLAKSNNINLICCVSPMYNAESSLYDYEPIQNLCDKYGVPSKYYVNNQNISTNRRYFANRTHLNDAGAKAFTKLFVAEMNRGNYFIYK